MNSIIVTAIVKAAPGKHAALEEMLKNLLSPTHEEAGCLLYALHRSKDDSGTFVFIEKWQSEETLQKHMYSRHIRRILAHRDEMIAEFHMMRLEPVVSTHGPKATL